MRSGCNIFDIYLSFIFHHSQQAWDSNCLEGILSALRKFPNNRRLVEVYLVMGIGLANQVGVRLLLNCFLDSLCLALMLLRWTFSMKSISDHIAANARPWCNWYRCKCRWISSWFRTHCCIFVAFIWYDQEQILVLGGLCLASMSDASDLEVL